VTITPAPGGLPPSALQPYANASILLFSNAIPGVLDSERHGTTVTTLRGLNPTITDRPSEQLPLGSWLFLPKRRAAANADTSTTSLPAGFYTPETLATYLGVSLSTIYSWNSSGYGPPFMKLGNLVRYTYEDVELWLARQLELSRG
jgi:excisionase family DNA binding protein